LVKLLQRRSEQLAILEAPGRGRRLRDEPRKGAGFLVSDVGDDGRTALPQQEPARASIRARARKATDLRVSARNTTQGAGNASRSPKPSEAADSYTVGVASAGKSPAEGRELGRPVAQPPVDQRQQSTHWPRLLTNLLQREGGLLDLRCAVPQRRGAFENHPPAANVVQRWRHLHDGIPCVKGCRRRILGLPAHAVSPDETCREAGGAAAGAPAGEAVAPQVDPVLCASAVTCNVAGMEQQRPGFEAGGRCGRRGGTHGS